MLRTGLWHRVFLGLALAVLGLAAILAATLALADSILAGVSPALVASGAIVATIGWAAMLATVFTRVLADEDRMIMAAARRGHAGADADSAPPELAKLLEERNRQVAALAEHASRWPIDGATPSVVDAIVTTAQRVMNDPTWRCAVLVSDDPELLATGVYDGMGGDRGRAEIGDLEQWASTSTSGPAARHVAGPWGAFAIVDLTVSGGLRAILYAPWEGRRDPTPAELDLLRLIGDHAGTALEHSVLYARVRLQAEELNRLASVQADFLRGVTHDLQTPLTRISAIATDLRDTDGARAADREHLEMIAHQADRLHRLVSQLLVASRLEAGALTPQVEVFTVGPLIERTWAALKADRPFDFRVDGDAYLAVGDPDRTEQVLWAVLDNAVKYSPESSPIEVRVAPRNSRLRVSIRDEGLGMSDEARALAFDQFYRAPDARRAAPDGSGVGLYAARGLVQAMGGSIEIESALGGGTSVHIELPAERAAAD